VRCDGQRIGHLCNLRGPTVPSARGQASQHPRPLSSSAETIAQRFGQFIYLKSWRAFPSPGPRPSGSRKNSLGRCTGPRRDPPKGKRDGDQAAEHRVLRERTVL